MQLERQMTRWALGLALPVFAGLLGCAGQARHIDFFDPNGAMQRVTLAVGASPGDVEAVLGRPHAVQDGFGARSYWLYTFDRVRHRYVLVFRGDRLTDVRYVPPPGEAR